jgi:bacteriocin biosynthesis cyclodehydratase domain-containing protein
MIFSVGQLVVLVARESLMPLKISPKRGLDLGETRCTWGAGTVAIIQSGIFVKESETSPIQANLPQSLRPKLLHDSVFLPAKDGVLFRSHLGTFTVRSSGAYQLMTQLAPHLSGAMTVSEICSSFAPDRHQAIRDLIALLLKRRIVIDHIVESSDLDESVLHRFRAQIEFIEHCTDLPVAKFQRFRRSRIFLTGSGIPLRSVVLSLLRNGLETIILDERVSDLEHDDEIASLAKQLRHEGISVIFEKKTSHEALAPSNHGWAAIGYAGDICDLQDLMAINEFCCKQDVIFIPGFLFGSKAMTGPLVRGRRGGCWLCALLRHSACIKPEQEALLWRHLAFDMPWRNDCQPASSPSLRILGNSVAFELFRALVGHIPSETNGHILLQDMETLETSRSRLLPHPLCLHCSPPASNVAGTLEPKQASGSDLDLAKKMARVSKLVDADFGIAREYGDDRLAQIPLFQTSLAMSRQAGMPECSIPGYSLDSNMGARLNATLEVIRSYSVLMIDMRRMLVGTAAEAQQVNLAPLSPQELTGWISEPARASDARVFWMRAQTFQAADERQYLVPAAGVYTHSSFNQGEFEKSNSGIGVGFAFEEACRDAVLSLFAQEMLKDVAKREAELAQLDLPSLAATNVDIQYLYDNFLHLGMTVRLLASSRGGHSLVLAVLRGPEQHSQITVGSAEFLEQAATAAMIELLAFALGGKPLHTLEHYLPSSLGYAFSIPVEDLAPYESPEHSAGKSLDSMVLHDPGSICNRILIIDLSTPDLLSCGLFAVKTLFVKNTRL